jgi:3,4-dihydroxy 2-butanone 4-phosphate synthase
MPESQPTNEQLEQALDQIRHGGFVLLHDSAGRENEIDLVASAEQVTPEHVRTLREEAGGLLCLALGNEVMERLGIAGVREIQLLAADRYPVLKLLDEENAPYGGKSPFSITISHRRTFTGITDRDRALTISEMGKLSRDTVGGVPDCQEKFGTEFKSPGHVHLLSESKRSLAERRGHTELSIYLCRLAGSAPAAAICEMLDGRTHNALSLEDARKYAQNNSFPFLEGQQLVDSFAKEDES